MVLRALLTAVLVSASGLIPLWTSSAHAAARRDFSTVAHRGYHARATENTLGSLRLARDFGATAMESDIRLTSDRRIVVMHDATLDRTTTCTGPVDQWTKKRIKEQCREEDGQRIPFAVDLLDAANNQRMNLLLEIKPDRQARWVRSKVRELTDLIGGRSLRDRVMLSSPAGTMLGRVESVARNQDTVWLAPAVPTVTKVESKAADNVSARADDLTPKLVTNLNVAGHLVYGRVSNSQADWESYRRSGVSGVVTDALPEYVSWSASQP